MSQNKPACYCAVILILVLSGCVAPAIAPTVTLPPKPTATKTQTPRPTLIPRLTETFIPELSITETKLPWPTPDWAKACGTVTIGKPGTQSEDKTHPVLVQGTAILCDEEIIGSDGYETPVEPYSVSLLDLDTGSSGFNQPDLEFSAGSIRADGRRYPFHYVGAVGDAFSALWSVGDPDPPEPTFDQCQSLSNEFNTDNPPRYVCVITDAGHVARIKVEDYAPLNEWGSIKISFITWDVVVPMRTPTP